MERDHRRPTRRPRGRPQRLPSDESPITAATFDGNKRLAWVLTTRRLMGPSAAGVEPASRAEFAELLRQSQIRADPTRISRWESGLEHLPTRLVQAYEQATDAPSGSLVAVRRLLTHFGHVEERPLSRSEQLDTHPASMDDTLDRVHAGSMEGVLWQRFADELLRYDRVFLRKQMWRATTDLLVEELARSTGLSYLLRFEAAATLMAHPVAGVHLGRSVGKFALGSVPGPLVPRVLSVLGQSPDGAAVDLLLKMVASDQSGLGGSAAQIASSLIDRGRVSAEAKELEVRAGRAMSTVPDGSLPHVDLVGLACRLAEQPFNRVLSALSDPHSRRWLQQARSLHLLVSQDEARILVDHVASEAEIAVGRNAQDPDQMLRRLVLEMLFHSHADRRQLASTLVLSSPYAAEVARVVLRLTGQRDALIARLAWSASRRLGAALEPVEVEERARDEHRPEMTRLSLAAAAHVASSVSDAFASEIAALVDLESTDEATAAAGVVALGMNRRATHLQSLRRPSAAVGAEWFLRVGGGIHRT